MKAEWTGVAKLRRTQSDGLIARNRVRCRDAKCCHLLGPLDVNLQNATLADSGFDLLCYKRFTCPSCGTTRGERDISDTIFLLQTQSLR